MLAAFCSVNTIYKTDLNELVCRRNRNGIFPPFSSIFINTWSSILGTNIHVNILLEILYRNNLRVIFYFDGFIGNRSHIINTLLQEGNHIGRQPRNTKALIIWFKRDLCVWLRFALGNFWLTNNIQIITELLLIF